MTFILVFVIAALYLSATALFLSSIFNLIDNIDEGDKMVKDRRRTTAMRATIGCIFTASLASALLTLVPA